MSDWAETYFSDYEAVSEKDIADITQEGIVLKNGIFIDFSVCVENFKKTKPESSEACVGEREITDWSFTFYANPKPVMIQFIPRNKVVEFLLPNNTVKRFHAFQRKINGFGYTTYDIT